MISPNMLSSFVLAGYASVIFGSWQGSIPAGVFMFSLLILWITKEK